VAHNAKTCPLGVVLTMHDDTYLSKCEFFVIQKPGQPQPNDLFLDAAKDSSVWMASHGNYHYNFVIDRNNGQLKLYQVVRDVKPPVSVDDVGWGSVF